MPTFEAMVAGLAKPGQTILDSLTPLKIDLLHMAVGVSGEAGELLDAVKAHVFYCKPLDLTNVIEELGDMEFYMEHMRALLKITREETLAGNINKLGKRYVGLVYSDNAAQQRADKVPEPLQATAAKEASQLVKGE
jgi:NTP pyrophosphatase (non-canonical NTP hydrolase)